MSQPQLLRDLLLIAAQLAESLSERIPNSSSLQRNCQQTATNLRTWRNTLPSDLEFLNKPTGDKGLYKSILSPLSELLCIFCQLIWTAHELGKAPSLATISRTSEAEQKIQIASPSTKKFLDDLGVWQKPRKGYTPLAVLFDKTSPSDKRFVFMEKAVKGHMGACYGTLTDLTKKIDRARNRHVGLRLLAGKAS